MKLIESIKEIEDYKFFIFDIWGVIHDGINPYPNAKEAVEYLRSLNKKICFISNAPRRSSVVAQVLKKFGINEDLYDFIISSGEAVYIDLRENEKNNYNHFGKKYFYLGPDKDIDLLEGLNYQITSNINEAEFVLTTGFYKDPGFISEKITILEKILAKKLKMICANPDLKVVRLNGDEMNCAGLIGKTYQEMGGYVKYYGKPYENVYKIACNLFNNWQKDKYIAIGDSFDTDIYGAIQQKMDSLLITGGLLSNDLGISYWQNPDMNKLNKICAEHKMHPNFVISNLKL